MRRSAVRLRRWLLRAAPVTALCGLGWGTGGAAAGLALWMGLGLLLSSAPRYPYPRKRAVPLSRLVFVFILCVCCFGALDALLPPLTEGGVFPLPAVLRWIGIAGFSLSFGAWAL